MKQDYLLALDLGTSSIGYVVFLVDENENPVDIADLGVRVFSDGREPKTKEPLAVARRIARGVRRNRDRGQNRVRKLVGQLIEFGLLPEDDKQRNQVFNELCPYHCRYLAANESVEAWQLGRALFHLGRRRGFKSNRLSASDEETKFKEKISALKAQLGENTLGEYLYKKLQKNKELVDLGCIKEQKVIRFRGGETEFYADRAMYLNEFNCIKQQQKNALLNDEQWEELKETIFWQYPLKPVPKGKCRFFPDETRAHIDLPISHEFRIYQEVNALRYNVDGQEYKLDERQCLAIYNLLDTQKSLTFKSLAKKKDQHESPLFPTNAVFNLDIESRGGKLLGNKTKIELRKPELLGSLADKMDSILLNDIVHYLIEPLKPQGDKQVLANGSDIEQWLTHKLPSLTAEQVKALSDLRFKRGTASVSRKFMQRIVPVLKDTGLTYDKAVQYIADDDGLALHHSHFKTTEHDLLPYYGEVMPESVWGEKPEADKNKAPSERDDDAYYFGKIANPTVHVALNQLRFVVNRIIQKQGGKPAKVHVELTRDLKNSKDARDKISKDGAANKKNNERIKKFLKDEFKFENPSRADIQKILLWEELGKQGARICVFTGQPISACQLFNGTVEVEHIIPFSRCYDDSMSNKTLAFKSINHRKLNKTPDEAFQGDEYNAITQRAYAAFGNSSKFRRFQEGAFEEFFGGDKGNMIERMLNDTKYISRKAAQYLECVCPKNKIVSVNGKMTAILRTVWQLNQFKDKEEGSYREDHRHHIVDAFVVGLTSRSLIRALMSRSSQHIATTRNLYDFLKDRAPEINHLKEPFLKKLNHALASYKQDHAILGSMFNETAYGFGKDDDNQPVSITRKSVNALSFEEVFRVRGANYRQQLIDYLMEGEDIDLNALKIRDCTKLLKAKVGSDKQLAEKLQRFSEINQIKTLRLNVYNASVKPIASAPYKGYALNEYAYCDIWQIPAKRDKDSGRWSYKYEGSFVAFAEVAKYKQNPKRPQDKTGRSHPAAKRLMRLYKHDTIALFDKTNPNQTKVMRVAGFSSTTNRLDLQPNLYAGQDGRKYFSINVVFQDNQVSKLKL